MGRTDPFPRESLVGLHVLVVDDDADSRQVMRTVLSYCGALVTTAASAFEALDVLGRVVPDVLIVDLAMPGRDGFWLMSQIRVLPPELGGRIPALACTGHEEIAPDVLAAAGFEHFLRKPIDPWHLARLVAALARML